MAVLISGQLEPFNPSKYNVTRYMQRFKLFMKVKCHNCRKTGHISKVCQSPITKSQKPKKRPAKGLHSVNKEKSSSLEELTLKESNNLYMIYFFSSRSDPIS